MAEALKKEELTMPIPWVGKTTVGETPTGATQTVALPGMGKLSANRIGMELTYLILGMNADLCANLGDKLGAAKNQEQAVDATQKDAHAPPYFVESMRGKMAKFKAAL